MREDVRESRGLGRVAVLLICGATLAACNTAPNLTTAPPPTVNIDAPPVQVASAELPGNWGLASYHQDKDRDRTISAAKAACGNPYKITQGPNGGIMMYLADQKAPSEVFVKQTPDGRSFIGPRGAPGAPQDRVVTYYQNNTLVTVWLDQNVQKRYGTMVFVRCA
ncbi:MAG: hypothetical protein GY798_10410 [Hyphomicrobiales bacterium]|nr:hypothetical protein [Hyphomicrobiales bacterium]